MTRLMGDATHNAVPQLAAVPGLQMVAGYDSGSPDIDWTPADWALFPGIPHIHIDQAFNTTVNTQAHVVVFDVETGAYQPWQAGGLIAQNQTARPTIYVNQSNIIATVQSAQTAPNWKGDTWVAIPGWRPGDPWPAPVQEAIALGAVIVAVQNNYGNPAYDLSDVLDPTWPGTDPPPQENDMLIEGTNGAWYLLSGGRLHHISDPASLHIYQAMGIPQAGSPVSAGEEAALLASFPAGNPAVTVNATAPPYTINISGNVTPA